MKDQTDAALFSPETKTATMQEPEMNKAKTSVKKPVKDLGQSLDMEFKGSVHSQRSGTATVVLRNSKQENSATFF